jgi:hypothetical protein
MAGEAGRRHAGPIIDMATRRTSMGIEVGGLIGLIILIADVWAISHVIGSSASTGAKVLWVVLILVLPVIGLILWLIMGPRRAAAL